MTDGLRTKGPRDRGPGDPGLRDQNYSRSVPSPPAPMSIPVAPCPPLWAEPSVLGVSSSAPSLMRRRRFASSVPLDGDGKLDSRSIMDEPASPSPSTLPAGFARSLFERPMDLASSSVAQQRRCHYHDRGGLRMADLQGRMIGAMQADVKTLSEIEADS